MIPVGRWSLWRIGGAPVSLEKRNEFLAWQLLRRYGVVFRELLARESALPPWRALSEAYRRLEARGEIRGGRFVNGFVGDQFALPEAVELLRAARGARPEVEPVIISAADPLNLIGIVTPGARVSPYTNQAIAFKDGVPVEIGPLGAVRSKLQ